MYTQSYTLKHTLLKWLGNICVHKYQFSKCLIFHQETHFFFNQKWNFNDKTIYMTSYDGEIHKDLSQRVALFGRIGVHKYQFSKFVIFH